MLLSQGHEWIQFSGIVRLADIDQTNIVSGQVADARIEYAGDGAIQRSPRGLAVEVLQTSARSGRRDRCACTSSPDFRCASLAPRWPCPCAHAERVRDLGAFPGVRSTSLPAMALWWAGWQRR
jgi:hypothetical protein